MSHPLSAAHPRRTLLLVIANFGAGGAEHVMITLANALAQNYQVHLMVFDGTGPFAAAASPDVRVHNLGVKQVRYGGWPFIRSVRSIRPDLIVSTLSHVNFFVLFFSLFLPSVPVVVREAITPNYLKSRRFYPLMKLLYKVLYPRAAKIVAPTSLALGQLQDLTGLRPDKFQRILNPVNFDAYTNLTFPAPDPVVTRFVSCGRLDPQKGYDRLITALAAWKDRHDWIFDIFSDGPQRPFLEKLLVQYGLQDRVRLLGVNMEAPRKYKNYDYFLFPSRFEGLPNVVLESLAQGTKVIATREAGGVVDIAPLSTPGSLTLVETMDEFLREMDLATKPGARLYKKQNFLDPIFALPNIVTEYEAMITKAMR